MFPSEREPRRERGRKPDEWEGPFEVEPDEIEHDARSPYSYPRHPPPMYESRESLPYQGNRYPETRERDRDRRRIADGSEWGGSSVYGGSQNGGDRDCRRDDRRRIGN